MIVYPQAAECKHAQGAWTNSAAQASSNSAHACRPLKFVNCSKIASGRAVLLGDAAHAMSPNLGMGCNSALADAQVLGSCVATAGGRPEALAAAYNAARSRDVRALTRISRKLNDAVNLPYHGSIRRLLWGAPVYLSMIAGIVLKSPKTPSATRTRCMPVLVVMWPQYMSRTVS